MRNVSEEEAIASVGRGWEPLIRRLYAAKPPNVSVLQVKEKFGGLRFYTGPAPKGFHRLIEQAEAESYSICELCGRPGTADERYYWIVTLCEEHKQERAQRRESQDV